MLWDIDFKSAIAQAELEDRERPAAYYRVAFRKSDGSPLFIETTRPELIAACVALVAHPEDERYQALFGNDSHLPALRGGASGGVPSSGRPGEGEWHRHDLHMGRHHRRDLVA